MNTWEMVHKSKNGGTPSIDLHTKKTSNSKTSKLLYINNRNHVHNLIKSLLYEGSFSLPFFLYLYVYLYKVEIKLKCK